MASVSDIPDPPRIAIIGAGMCGLACAARLRQAGQAPVVFEKSRGTGGRMAARRADGLGFDHGAQYVTAKGAAFGEFLARAAAAGDAARWEPRAEPASGNDWHVGLPAMNGMLRSLADRTEIRLSTEVRSVAPENGRWLVDAGAARDVFDRVVCTAPAPQARQILAPVDDMAGKLAPVDIAPCWALMVAFDTPLAGLPDATRPGAGPLAWIARDASKPGRPAEPESWVVHARPDWSAAHLELGRDEVRDRLLALFADRAGGLPQAVHASAHRWRYAMTLAPLGQPFAASADGAVMAGGDWALGARVEAAYRSGMAMAEAVLTDQPS